MNPLASTAAAPTPLDRSRQPEPVVTIERVEYVQTSDSQLLGGWIDRPNEGDSWWGTALPCAGWALGTEVPAVAVDFVHQGRVIRKTPLVMRREDVADRYDEPVRARCGFRTSIGMLGLPGSCEILVRVVFDDGTVQPLATIRATHTPLPTPEENGWAPVGLTTLGRTGSTWFMRLIREHPEVAVHGGYPYETRSAAYWLHMVSVLANPANPHQSSHPDAFPDDLWTIGHHPFNAESLADEPGLRDWFRADYPKRLAALARQSIGEFYDRVADGLGKPDASRFAEKLTPGHVPRLMWELYPGGSEVMLVRDFRDMVCSILAFNAKRGFVAFGRENVDSDALFIESNLASGAAALLADWRERADRARLVRYEDLVLEPERTLTELYDGLGLACDAETVRASIERASGASGEMDRHRTSRDPRASIGRWRDELSPELIDVCGDAFGEVLQEFGYELD